MATDARFATLDGTALEDVARLAVAELAPGASQKSGRPSRRNAEVRAALTAEPDKAVVVIDAKSAGWSAHVTERELGEAIKAAFRKFIGAGEVVVFHGGSSATDSVVRKLVERLPSLVDARRQALTEKHIDALVDAYLPADALASVMPDIEADNATAQVDFLTTYPTLTADQVAERAGHAAANRSATANRWKGERKIFAIRASGREVYPAFQFKDGRPRTTLRPALEALGCRSGWQTAFWFITPNSWLGGSAPIDRLDDGEALLTAAGHETEAWAG